MIDLVGDFIEFLLRSTIAKLIGYILFLGFIVALLLEYGYFRATGELSLKIFINQELLGALANYYRKEIALFGIFTTLFFMGLYFYLQNKIAKRKNCAIQEVELAEIAKIWLEAEEYKQIIKQEISSEIPKQTKEEKKTFIVPAFNKEESRELFRFIEQHQSSFSELGIKVISDILKLLENNPVSSVASKFKQDPNYKDYNKMVIAGKTSYDILSEVDLYTHTIDVVNEAVKYLQDHNPDEKELYLERVIIAALCHDIGKIQKSYKNLTDDVYKKVPHNVISALILREEYPKLNEEIIEAVEQHHGAVKNKNNYTLKVLIEADKKAREKEIKEWLIKNQKTKDNNKDNKDIKNKDNTDKEQNINNEEINNKNQNINDKENNINNKNINNKENENKNYKNKEQITNNKDNTDEKNISETEEENIFEIDTDDLFEDLDEKENYESAKEKLIEKIGDEVCRVKKHSILGLDLNELIFTKEHNIYISFAFLNNIINDTNSFIGEALKRKEAVIKEVKIEAFNSEYKVKMIIFKDEALGLDVSNVNCDKITIKAER
jgi:putative nucleotidyltransferase with HDIG domain